MRTKRVGALVAAATLAISAAVGQAVIPGIAGSVHAEGVGGWSFVGP
jgi:hypothetical protein